MGIERFNNAPQEKITLSSETIESTPPPKHGTVIIMQRHGDYNRETGHLTLDGSRETSERSRTLIEGMLNQIPEEERASVAVLVVASPTQKNEGQRSMETAQLVIESVREAFRRYGIPSENLLTDTPRPVDDIEEPRIFKGDLSYFDLLTQKYGKGTREFWIAYEEDTHADERRRLGAEGPVDMSNRFAHFTHVLSRYARRYHRSNQNIPARLIIWNVSHYDTITTFFKNHVAHIDQKKHIPVDYDGGLSLTIDGDQNASIKMGEAIYPMDFASSGDVSEGSLGESKGA